MIDLETFKKEVINFVAIVVYIFNLETDSVMINNLEISFST